MSEIPSGWPCAGLPAVPPSVADVEAQPTADGLLPQLLPLTPRGAAWGTDEAGDGRGASPTQRSVWKAIAAWVADHLGRDWTAATQAFPTAITYTLEDWERELGLPDPCTSGQGGTAARLAAVRSKYASVGGQSGAYMVCLAKSLGYDITIEEPTQFMIDTSAVGEDPIVETFFTIDGSQLGPDPIVGDQIVPDTGGGDPLEGYRVVALDAATAAALDQLNDRNAWQYWIVHVASLGETYFTIDAGILSEDSIVGGVLTGIPGQGDPLEGLITPADLACVLRRACPEHTVLVMRLDL